MDPCRRLLSRKRSIKINTNKREILTKHNCINKLSNFFQILFGGASSGGLGMLGNIDYIKDLVKPAAVRINYSSENSAQIFERSLVLKESRWGVETLKLILLPDRSIRVEFHRGETNEADV